MRFSLVLIFGIAATTNAFGCVDEKTGKIPEPTGHCLVDGNQVDCDQLKGSCRGTESRMLQVVGVMLYPQKDLLTCKDSVPGAINFKLKSGRMLVGKPMRNDRYLLEVVDTDGTRRSIDW